MQWVGFLMQNDWITEYGELCGLASNIIYTVLVLPCGLLSGDLCVGLTRC